MKLKRVLFFIACFILCSSRIFSSPAALADNQATSDTLFVATGGFLSPLLLVGTNHARDWEAKTINNLPAGNAGLSGTSCTGSGDRRICIAVGNIKNSPLLTVSIDDGKTWEAKTIPHLPESGAFRGASCTGSGTSALCVAVGETSNKPLLVMSNDGGRTWSVNTNFPENNSFFAVSCAGNGTTAVCAAVGGGHDSTQPPIIAVSDDGGFSWHVKTFGDLFRGFLTGVSCTGSDINTVCTAAGVRDKNNNPGIVVSTDGAKTWEIKTFDIPEPSNDFMSTSCTGNGTDAICIATGVVSHGANPVLVISTDGGKTWQLANLGDIPQVSFLYSTSCTGNGRTAVCMAVGSRLDYSNKHYSLVAVSRDGGITWGHWNLDPNNSRESGLYSARCAGSGTNAICVAAGAINTSTGKRIPYIAANGRDIQIFSGLNGFFSSVSATSSE